MARTEMTGEGRAPRLKTPPKACECHSHIYGPADKYPVMPGRRQEPVASVAAYNDMLARLGFERAVIVQPAAYGSDNRCTVDAIAARGLERTRGICVTPVDVSAEALQVLHAQGMRGLRFLFSTGDYTLADAPEMAAKAAPLGWHLQFQDDLDWLEEAVPVMRDLPVDSVVDHIGRTDKTKGLADEGFQALLRFMETGKCWVKISGFYYHSASGAPNYEDCGALVKALVDVRPDRLVWAANWPHPGFPLDAKPEEADILDPLLDWVPDEKTRRMILADNPAALYGFE
jgi:D-galactarolactone isomerase